MVTDANGERWRFEELGYVSTRHGQQGQALNVWHPADGLGDCASTMPMLQTAEVVADPIRDIHSA